jgi:hypothetical protein
MHRVYFEDDPAMLLWTIDGPKRYATHVDNDGSILTRTVGTLLRLDSVIFIDSGDDLINWLTDSGSQEVSPIVVIPTDLAEEVCGWKDFNFDLLG